MGKYDCGVSMKTAIKNDFNEIMGVLEKYGVTGEDQKTVMDNYKHLAYEWCNSNAAAYAFDNQVTKKIGCAEYLKCIDFTDAKYNNDVREKMKETYPWWYECKDKEEK